MRSIAVVLALLVMGCADGPSAEIATEPQPSLDAGDAGDDQSTSDAGDSADAVGDGALEADVLDAGPFVVGLVPTPRDPVDTGGLQAARTEAWMTSLAAGAGAIVVSRAWNELAPTSDTMSPDVWDELSAASKLVQAQRRGIVLSIDTVEGLVDKRPADLANSAWNSAAAETAIKHVLDRVFATFGEELWFVSLGLEVDLYLQSRPTHVQSFTEFAVGALHYALQHPAKPARVQLGLTWSAREWLVNELAPQEWLALVEPFPVVMFAYYPIDDELMMRTAGVASTDLATLLSRVGSKPLVIQRAAYASSQLVGGSEAAQAQFIEELLTAGANRRGQVPLIAVSALHNPSPEECVAHASSHGAKGSPELYTFWCSSGLRRRDGSPKQAYATFLKAAAAHLSP